MEYDFEWLGISGKKNQISQSSVEGLGGLVGSLLELLVVRSLVTEVVEFLGELWVGLWPGSALFVAILYHFTFY